MPEKLKLGDEFNKRVTRETIKKKLPIWTEYTWTNVQYVKDKIDKEFDRMDPRQKLSIAAQRGLTNPTIKDRDAIEKIVKRYLTYNHSVEAMRSKLLMLPCLVVGYGNSFHETVDMLKDIPRDKVNIVASERALRKLVENGVVPDLTVNLDSGNQIKPFYNVKLPERDKLKLKSAFAITTCPKNKTWFHGQKLWYIPAITPWENNLTEETAKSIPLPIVPTAGNVGTTSVILSKICGANPIFLIGFDFGRELVDEKDPKATEDTLCASKDMIVKVGDRKFITDPVLHAYAHAFRRLLMYYVMNVVNLSAGILHGSFIKTGEPLPEKGGTSRDRVKAFIDAIKEWKIPDEIVKVREDFKAGNRSINQSFFMPQKRMSDKEWMELTGEVGDETLVVEDAPK